MKNFKDVLKYLFSKKVLIIAIILILVLVLVILPVAYFLTVEDAIFDEKEKGKPSNYTQNVEISSDNGTVTLTVDKDAMIKEALKNLGYTDKEIEKLTDEEIIEIFGINNKLKKDPKVTSLDDVTQAEILWCLNDVYSKYLNTPEELEKLLNAEIITQYPKMGQDDAELNGIIQFERYKTDGKSVMLTYIDSETFNGYVNSGNKKALDYFTLDDEGNALISVLNTTTETITSNDPEMNISEYAENLDESNKKSDGSYTKTETQITTEPIDYKKNVEKYTMPFQYLWALLVIGEDKDFVLELADLVEGSEITISIYDNAKTSINIDEYTYSKQTKTETYVGLFIPNTFGVSSVPAKGYWIAEDSQWANQYGNKYPADYSELTEYKVTHTIKYETNSTVIDLTKANVWIVDYSKGYEYQKPENTSTETNETTLEDTEYVLAPGSPQTSANDSSLLNNAHALQLAAEAKQYIETNRQTTTSSSEGLDEVVVSVSEVECNIYNHIINRNQKTTVKEYQQKYVAQTPVKKDKIKKDDEEPNFVTILCDGTHNKAKKLITSEVTSWLFEILEASDDTKEMVELTKILLNKVLGEEKFDTDFDFSVFSNSNFSSATGSIYGNSIQEKVWFMLKDLGYSDIAAAGAMGNIHYESTSFNPSAIEDGYNENTGGIGICQWTNNKRGPTGRNTNLKQYAMSKGSNWQDENIQVEFLRGELSKGGGADGYATYQLSTTVKYYDSSLACASAWENATSVEDATKAFCYSFERPGKKYAQSSMATRISYAKQYYDMYSGMEAPQELDTTLTGENKSKMQSMISEAIRIANDDRYQYSQSFRESEFYYDCSSFVSRLYTRYFGLSRLDSGSAGRGTDNIRTNCKNKYIQVSLTSLQPGDIVWRDGHVALYIGNNQTAEASSTKTGIVVKTFKNYTEAYRVIK